MEGTVKIKELEINNFKNVEKVYLIYRTVVKIPMNSIV